MEKILIEENFNKLKKEVELKLSTNSQEELTLYEKTKKKEEVQEPKTIQEIDPFIQNSIEDIQTILAIRYPSYLEDIKDLRTLIRDYRKEQNISLTNEDKNFYGRLNKIELRSSKRIKAFKKYNTSKKISDLFLPYDKTLESDVIKEPVLENFSRTRKLHENTADIIKKK